MRLLSFSGLGFSGWGFSGWGLSGWGLSSLTLLVGLSSSASSADFPGWQALRVVQQKGRPNIMRAADLDGDGREELVVVNSRSSRLDIYAYREESAPAADKRVGERSEPYQPNELPLAPDMEHQQLQLENVPRDVLLQDLDGDGQPEMIVLASSPNQVAVYRRRSADDQHHRDQHYRDDHSRERHSRERHPRVWHPRDWQQQFSLDLLAGDIPSRRDALLIRPMMLPSGASGFQLLVSLENGIQEVLLHPGGRAQWLTPREQRGRLAWWLADLDGDGRDDLIEQTRESNESVRWYRASASGALTPAAVIRNRGVKDVAVMRTNSAAQLVVLDAAVRGILRRFDFELGAVTPFGQQLPLALEDGPKSVWCGMWQGEQRALVVADSDSPRLLSYGLSKSGWESQQAYPALTDVRGLATLAAKPGTLLLWTKDAADLQQSHWESGRLTYPKPWPQSAEVEDRKILALDSVGSTTWWVQKVGKHLDLYLAEPSAEEPKRVRFANVGAKADQVLWIGGERLLVKETHGRALQLFVRDGESAVVTSPTHLKKATLGEFQLFAVGQSVRLGQLTDGVLQWLGDDLRSHEQVMLPQGQPLSDYVAVDEGHGWALQRDSPFVHRIQIDASRLSESVETVKLAAATGLLSDPVLGMLLVGQDRLTQLSEGRARELKLIDVIDELVGRAGGVRKTLFHRLSTTDIDRDGYDDLVLYDELQHRLTVLGLDFGKQSKDGAAALQPKIAWPVFDDKVYPYNDKSDNLVSEPRTVLAADFDGDHQQDLAILCHDRLIVYLAREKS